MAAGGKDNLVGWEMILVALFRAAEESTRAVPYEDIVIEAWRAFPQSFALRNYPEHPDASDVHKRLSDTKRRGLTVSLGRKHFRLTDKGREEAERLNKRLKGEVEETDGARQRLSRQEATYFEHAVRSPAFQLWREGKGEELIDYDAQLFFRFATSTAMDERRRRVDAADQTFKKAAAMGRDHAEELGQLLQFLKKRFAALLEEAK